MGMFDTIYGEIKCPYCGKMQRFEEQTKQYECCLNYYTYGDYLERGNYTDACAFDTYCENCLDENGKPRKFEGNIVFVKGQIVKFLNNEELENINIKRIQNIEEGLGKRVEYEKKCEAGAGFAKERYYIDEVPKNIGERIKALGTEWLIVGVYEEILVHEDSRAYGFHKAIFRPSVVYRVESNKGTRMIRVTDSETEVNYPENTASCKMSELFMVQYGCVLKEI